MTKTMSKVTMESLLKEVGECGLFHLLVVNIIHLCKIHLAFSMLFMSYGIYNPGWRCADPGMYYNNNSHTNSTLERLHTPNNNNNNVSFSISPDVSLSTENDLYNEESCQVFESCNNVQFNPEASTIVTEWGLLCDQAWIGSLIISLQMIGTLVGSLLTGYFGDRFGRKNTLLACLFLHTVLNLVIIFVKSWTMFAVCRFLIGVVCAFFRFLPFVYSSEFVPPKWRGPIACHPIFATAAIIMAVVCMLTKDWVQVHVVTTTVSAVTFLLVLWVPKSIRWLAVKGKEKEAFRVVTKMAKINNKQTPDRSRVQALIAKYNDKSSEAKKYKMLDLFRKGFRMSAVVVAFLFFTDNLSYYAISLGVKSLPGNLFINLIVMYSTEYIANIYTAVTGNILGRKLSLMVSLVGSTVCLLGVVVFDRFALGEAKDFGVLILAMSVTMFNNITWYVLTAYMTELYPTVIRSTIVGWGSLNAQFGAIVAPYFIPNSPDYLYICYLIMGCLNLVSCFLFFFLEDTTKKSLSDTWDMYDHSRRSSKDLNGRSPLPDDQDVELLDVNKSNQHAVNV